MADIELDELSRRLGEEGLVLLEARTPREFDGTAGAHCDARQGEETV